MDGRADTGRLDTGLGIICPDKLSPACVQGVYHVSSLQAISTRTINKLVLVIHSPLPIIYQGALLDKLAGF